MSEKHGGKRQGAGRPLMWDWEIVANIGSECEKHWNLACDQACEIRLRGARYQREIEHFHKLANAVPVEQRREWLRSEDYKDHVGDLESWLHERGGTQYDEDAPRLMTISRRPFRGTRRMILGLVSMKYGLTSNQVDNIWQKFRSWAASDELD